LDLPACTALAREIERDVEVLMGGGLGGGGGGDQPNALGQFLFGAVLQQNPWMVDAIRQHQFEQQYGPMGDALYRFVYQGGPDPRLQQQQPQQQQAPPGATSTAVQQQVFGSPQSPKSGAF
jgi:hypothetical protein